MVYRDVEVLGSRAMAGLRLSDALHEAVPLPVRERQALAAAQLHTVADLLLRAPRRYEDRRIQRELAGLAEGETVCLRLHAYSAGWRFSYKRYFEVSAGNIGDPHGVRLLLRWFNMPYVAKLLAVGMRLSVYGRVRFFAGRMCMINPDFEVMEDEDTGHRLAAVALGETPDEMVQTPGGAEPQPAASVHTGRIVPIYRAVAGVSPRSLRQLVWELLQRLPADVEPLGYDVAPAYPYGEALRDLHFPAEMEAMRKARLRLALGECFGQQFRVAWRRMRTLARPGQVTATTDGYVEELLAGLPFALTGAQQRCLSEIRADMEVPRPMNRLLQGDVGSGKTLVALCAMLLAVESGKTAAMLAPTQILAEQHYHRFRRLLHGMDVRLSLRTADRVDDSGLVLEAPDADDGAPRLVVGTHALLYNKNRPARLGLAVIDEQHKFGVEQRERFINSGDCPDVLVMTATPIPRTLTLTMYGDLDVSVIDELPAQRGKIVTALRNPDHMKRVIRFMHSELAAGRQIYIVSPLIEERESREDADGVRKGAAMSAAGTGGGGTGGGGTRVSARHERSAAVTELERWRAEFPEASVGLLHGRLSAEEKSAVMGAFQSNETQVLVATSVVEVGGDVPNATLMLINDAESFGLSQLHQLRGRIGRGSHRSYCILLSRSKQGEPGYAKLEILCRTLNGFEIAEEDFRLRGPGDVLGTAQSGLGSVQYAEWLSDARLIHRARREAEAVLRTDPELSRPEHAALRALVSGEGETAVVG